MDSLPAEPPAKPNNTGLGSLSLLQRIFPTQELNQGLLHCRQILYQLSYQGSCGELGIKPTATKKPHRSQLEGRRAGQGQVCSWGRAGRVARNLFTPLGPHPRDAAQVSEFLPPLDLLMAAEPLDQEAPPFLPSVLCPVKGVSPGKSSSASGWGGDSRSCVGGGVCPSRRWGHGAEGGRHPGPWRETAGPHQPVWFRIIRFQFHVTVCDSPEPTYNIWSIWNPVTNSQVLSVDRIYVSFQFFLTQQHRHVAPWLELCCLLLCCQDDTPSSSHLRESWHPAGLFISMLPLLLNFRKDGVGQWVRQGSRRPTPSAVSQADFCPKGRCHLILQSCLLQHPTLSIDPGEECLGPAFLVYTSRTGSGAQSPGQTESLPPTCLPVTRNSPLPSICPCLAFCPPPPLQCSHSRLSTCMFHTGVPVCSFSMTQGLAFSNYFFQILHHWCPAAVAAAAAASHFSRVQLCATP